MVGSIIDITELKTTEEKLRESEERFRLAAKATRDAIWDWDRERNYVWRSKGFQNLFGYESDDDRRRPSPGGPIAFTPTIATESLSQLPDMERNPVASSARSSIAFAGRTARMPT